MIVLRKNISREKGQARLFDEIRYFFFITNDWTRHGGGDRVRGQRSLPSGEPARPVAGGVHALHASVDNLTSNWAYMVMTSLAWNLKAWSALIGAGGPAPPGGHTARQKHWLLRMEFKRFVQHVHPDAVPDRPRRPPIDLSALGVERVARRVSASGSCPAAEVQRERSRDLDVPAQDGVLSQKGRSGGCRCSDRAREDREASGLHNDTGRPTGTPRLKRRGL